MDRSTGAPLTGDAHLAQSIGDILMTPLGSRVMLRDYGSMLFELLDRPLNAATRLMLYAATAMALTRWEPRLRLTRVSLSAIGSDGHVTMDIQGVRTDTPNAKPTRIFVPLTQTLGH